MLDTGRRHVSDRGTRRGSSRPFLPLVLSHSSLYCLRPCLYRLPTFSILTCADPVPPIQVDQTTIVPGERMGAGAYLEPLVVVTLLFGGAWINRATEYNFSKRIYRRNELPAAHALETDDHLDIAHPQLNHSKRSLSPSLLPSQADRWRERDIRIAGYQKTVVTPNTAAFRNRFLSRLLHKFPFLVEAWYWALIYWVLSLCPPVDDPLTFQKVYQLGRAFTALTLVEGTVNVARRHALQVIAVERHLHILWEIPIQRFFMSYPIAMKYINWFYSFIHIPGTIAFLVWLFYYTITSNRLVQERQAGQPGPVRVNSAAGPRLYEARRRTMATCNLLAFVVFTLWPCMPPRLLSDPAYSGPDAELAKSFGFVDTVHGAEGASSVWTQNKFCNQYGTSFSRRFIPSVVVSLLTIRQPPCLLSILAIHFLSA